MYKVVTIRDAIRVPPARFGEDLEKAAVEVLREQYENKLDKDLGVILAIEKVGEVGVGRIIAGDGATYHNVSFDALVFSPELNEVVEGNVSEIVEFGAFIRIGPIDGLIHVSQITDDFISYNSKTAVLSGKESGKVLKEGDTVRARIVTLSMKEVITESKIGLTMRQPALGKLQWIEQEREKKAKKAEKKKK